VDAAALLATFLLTIFFGLTEGIVTGTAIGLIGGKLLTNKGTAAPPNTPT
jgi:thiamine transporter ThiT